MCKVLILLFIIINFVKNPENAPNLLALDHHLPLRIKELLAMESKIVILYINNSILFFSFFIRRFSWYDNKIHFSCHSRST